MVWMQANKFNVPRIAFINKMDRPGASLEFTVQTIIKKLNVTPFVLQLPLGESESFHAVVDLLQKEIIQWTDSLGCIVEKTPIPDSHRAYQEFLKARDKLFENISLFDDKFAVFLFIALLIFIMTIIIKKYGLHLHFYPKIFLLININIFLYRKNIWQEKIFL